MRPKIRLPFLFVAFVSVFFAFACKEEPEKVTDSNDRMIKKIDSLSMKLDSISKQLAKKDSVPDSVLTVAADPVNVISEEKKQNEIKPKAEEKKVKTSDTTFYYYTGTRKKSVVVTPWVNGRRKVLFYSQTGKLNYQNDDVHMSWSNTTELKSFHPNGAASLIIVHNNPGASMYMYETSISFGTDNEPQWKTSRQIPEERLGSDVKFKWDKTSQTWIKQENEKEPVMNN